jgi:branched-chain amino acid transport system ATP-binding protein
MTTGTLLSCREVSVRFGGILALDRVSVDVPAGSIYGLIGPNGAGKTTLFNCLSRLYRYQSGDLLFRGRSLAGCSSHDVAGLGIGRTFQNLAMFATLRRLGAAHAGGSARGGPPRRPHRRDRRVPRPRARPGHAGG